VSFERTLNTYIADEMERKHIPGLSLAIVEDGKIVIEKSYGFANAELRVPATSDTVYEIASITKSFTAVAILMLAQEGRLNVDDPITKYRAGLPDPWQAITLRHLLTHTSGIQDWRLNWDRRDLTAEMVAESIFGPALQWPAGSAADDCDVNFNLLGMVIHQLTGAPYDVFLRERIFEPLGMSATRHNDVSAIIPNRANGYDRRDEQLINSFRIRWNNINLSPSVPANGANGSLLSTLTDMLTWDAALADERLLPQSVLQPMFTPVILNDGTQAPFGFGGEVETYQGHKLVAFNGGSAGFTSSISRFVDDQLSVIVLTNQDSKPWDMCKEVAALFDPALAE
jgi:D-alanyl-D-alanine carboxypeptidase